MVETEEPVRQTGKEARVGDRARGDGGDCWRFCCVKFLARFASAFEWCGPDYEFTGAAYAGSCARSER